MMTAFSVPVTVPDSIVTLLPSMPNWPVSVLFLMSASWPLSPSYSSAVPVVAVLVAVRVQPSMVRLPPATFTQVSALAAQFVSSTSQLQTEMPVVAAYTVTSAARTVLPGWLCFARTPKSGLLVASPMVTRVSVTSPVLERTPYFAPVVPVVRIASVMVRLPLASTMPFAVPSAWSGTGVASVPVTVMAPLLALSA